MHRSVDVNRHVATGARYHPVAADNRLRHAMRQPSRHRCVDAHVCHLPSNPTNSPATNIPNPNATPITSAPSDTMSIALRRTAKGPFPPLVQPVTTLPGLLLPTQV